MIFNCGINLGGEIVNGVIMLVHNTEDGKHICMTAKDIVSSPTILPEILNLGYKLEVVSVYNCDYPVLVCKAGERLNISKLIDVINSRIVPGMSTESIEIIFNQIIKVLNNNCPGGNLVTQEDIIYLADFVNKFFSFYKGEERWSFSVPSNFVGDIRATNLLKSYTEISKVRENFCKETLFMERPDSKVGISLPSYAEITSELFDPEKYLPNIHQVFRVYDKMELFTIRYKDVIGESNVPLEWVVGNSENDDLPIQDNEKDFYNAMCSLIDTGTLAEHPDKSAEQLKEVNICSSIVRDYLFDLLTCVMSWNFSHSKYVKLSKNIGLGSLNNYDEEDNDEDEDEYNEKEENKQYVASKDVFQVDPSSFSGDESVVTSDMFNSEYVLRDFISKCCTVDKYSICEAIIKMMRWGSRKPKRIKIEATGEYFDPTECKVSKSSNNYSDSCIDLEDGKKFVVAGIINNYGRFGDSNYLRANDLEVNSMYVPVGYILYTPYTDGNIKYSYVSAFEFEDIVDQVILPDNKDEDLINLSLDKVCSLSTGISSNGTLNSLLTSPSYAKLYSTFNCFSKTNSLLRVIDDYSHKSNLNKLMLFESFTKEAILEDIRKGAIPSVELDMYLANMYLPAFLKAASKFEDLDEFTFNDCRKVYKDVISECLLDGAMILRNEDSSKVEAKIDSINDSINALMKKEPKLEESKVFGSSEETKNDSIKESSNKSNTLDILVKPIDNSCDYYKVIDSKREVILFVGKAVVNGQRVYHATYTNSFTGNFISNTQLRGLAKLIFHTIYNVMVGDYKDIKIVFDKPDTLLRIGNDIHADNKYVKDIIDKYNAEVLTK